MSIPPAPPPFLGTDIAVNYQQSRVVILPIPYEATTTYRKGCEHGPASILDASQQVEFYDEELDWEIGYGVGIHTFTPIADTRILPKPSAEEMLEITRQTILQLVTDHKFVVALGGNIALPPALLMGIDRLMVMNPLPWFKLMPMVICGMSMKVPFITMPA